MLWIGERLSTLERLSIASFLANGHPVHLYTYGPVAGVPEATQIRDANEILTRELIFRNPPGFGEGSFAGFSNLFRYKLLLDRGGIWCDCDIVCLRPFDFITRGPLLTASERLPPDPGRDPQSVQLNNCFVMAPAGTEAIRECFEVSLIADKTAFQWGDLGPRLVTRVFLARGLQSCAIPPDVICPVDWWRIEAVVMRPFTPPPICHALHLYNEAWRQKGLSKDGTYAPDSAYEALKRRYLG
jgi:hypothetical protein